jgi:hypothetical protein
MIADDLGIDTPKKLGLFMFQSSKPPKRFIKRGSIARAVQISGTAACKGAGFGWANPSSGKHRPFRNALAKRRQAFNPAVRAASVSFGGYK